MAGQYACTPCIWPMLASPALLLPAAVHACSLTRQLTGAEDGDLRQLRSSCAPGALVAALAAVLLPSCGDDADPAALDVRVTYVSRIVGCPDQASECYPMCIHHNTPAGVRIVNVYKAMGGGRVAEAERLTQQHSADLSAPSATPGRRTP
jgi:hypothetical protein